MMQSNNSSNEKALRWVLKAYNIPQHEFSIGGAAEQCVCLEHDNDIYTVYMVERGTKFEESQHRSEVDAHLKMMYHLSPTKLDYDKMCNLYKMRLLKQKKPKKAGQLIKVQVAKSTEISTNLPTAVASPRTVGYIYFKTAGTPKRRVAAIRGSLYVAQKSKISKKDDYTIRKDAHLIKICQRSSSPVSDSSSKHESRRNKKVKKQT